MKWIYTLLGAESVNKPHRCLTRQGLYPCHLTAVSHRDSCADPTSAYYVCRQMQRSEPAYAVQQENISPRGAAMPPTATDTSAQMTRVFLLPSPSPITASEDKLEERQLLTICLLCLPKQDVTLES